MEYKLHDLVIVSRVGNVWTEGRHPDATQVCYSVLGMDISKAEYDILEDILLRWEAYQETM